MEVKYDDFLILYIDIYVLYIITAKITPQHGGEIVACDMEEAAEAGGGGTADIIRCPLPASATGYNPERGLNVKNTGEVL